jgi:hypothetical protein
MGSPGKSGAIVGNRREIFPYEGQTVLKFSLLVKKWLSIRLQSIGATRRSAPV